MRGDRVEVIIEVGNETRTFDIEATKNGRRIVITSTRGGFVEVTEETHTGRPVRTAKFMSSKIVAMVEHPAADALTDDEKTARAAAVAAGVAAAADQLVLAE